MGNDKTPSQGGASQTDIDAKLYKVLLDLEIRLDSKFEKSRQQNKEDTQNIVELAVSRAIQPVLAEVSGIKDQLKEGNRRFDEQSSRIKKAGDVAAQAASDALVAKTERQLPLQAADDATDGGSRLKVKEIIGLIGAIAGLLGVVMGSMAFARVPPAAPTEPPVQAVAPSTSPASP